MELLGWPLYLHMAQKKLREGFKIHVADIFSLF